MGIPGHERTRKVSGVCQLFPKTGGGDLTHGAAPLQGFWWDAAHCLAAVSATCVLCHLPLC